MSELRNTLGELIENVHGAKLTGDPAVSIAQLEYDSRQIRRENSLFFAVTGYSVDGYDFVSLAKAGGAVAVVGERESCDEIEHHIHVPNTRVAMAEMAARYYGYPARGLKIAGVTGTNGKTTTCHLIRTILQTRHDKVGLVSTQVYDTGMATFPADRTTPESLDLQRLMFLMRSVGCRYAVLEVSSHALSLHRVDGIEFRVAVFTNITRDHLDFHGTMEDYLAAKAKLLHRLSGPMCYAVINLDVDEFRPLFGANECSYMSYSLEQQDADIRCGDYELKPERTIFDLITPMGNHTVTYNLPGRFNLINALAAAGGALGSGIDIDNVVQGLESAEPIPGRLNTVQAGQPFAVYIDYAHTSDALERLCETVRELVDGRLLILFGCGGDRDKGKRPLMGKAATTFADYAVLTTDNPRSESPEAIIEDVKPGLVGSEYEIEADRKKAIEKIISLAKPGDAVLLAGKGAEPYQEVKGVRHPFSDKEEALASLAKLGFTHESGMES